MCPLEIFMEGEQKYESSGSNESLRTQKACKLYHCIQLGQSLHRSTVGPVYALLS
ncbi:hypothetical protein J6590_095747 [Homalodisca vitripennis]|nr:hypothetical protein J6590_095747 [Homalodisca vitripennis]